MKKFSYLALGLLVTPILWVGAQDIVFQDDFENTPPVITSLPITKAAIGAQYTYDVTATDANGDSLIYELTTAPGEMIIDTATGLIKFTPPVMGSYPVEVMVTDGNLGFDVQAWTIDAYTLADSDADGLPDSQEDSLGTDPGKPDTDGDGFGDGSEVAIGTDPLDPNDFPSVPQDPKEIAPEPDPGVASTVVDATRFLYTGDDPVQVGVAADTIKPERAAVLRGLVTTRLGAPLPGVAVTVLGRTEFGSTLTRADGMFDLVVNGGSPLTIDYQLDGYLPSQRTVEVAHQQYALASDVVLIPMDPVVTSIDLDVPGDMKVARGSVQGDADGIRQATILFPAGVSAELRMADDSMVPISDLSVRATEYTVGDSGPEAMPGDLPPTSGYTYAVELSVDEAMSAGAASVEFDQPLPFYVENFLGFPSGTPVPTGYYDRARGAWVPAPDGLVIDIIGETGSMADIDLDGDGQADSGTALDELGITDAERTQIANLYEPGQSLWRVPIEHFTSWDHNWPIGPPGDAIYPGQDRAYQETYEDGMCMVEGSIIECQNQLMRKQVALAGTPLTLNYNSAWVPGRLASRHLDIPLTDAEPPESLERVDLSVSVAGQVHEYSYEPGGNLVQPFTWDGFDAYGRLVQGKPSAHVRIAYRYAGVYRTGADSFTSFGLPGVTTIEVDGNRTRADFTLPQTYRSPIGSWDARGQGLGGWTLNIHHAYDPNNRTLYRGDGTSRSADSIPDVLTRVVGTVDDHGWAERCPTDPETDEFDCHDGSPAKEAYLRRVRHIAFGPDGSMYITQLDDHRVRRVGPDGIIDTFAGTGESYRSGQDGSLGPNGDGGPAHLAKLDVPYSIAVDTFGNVYIGEFATRRIRKVDVNGIISTFAGGGDIYPPNGPARDVKVWPLGMEVDPAGNLFVVDICTVFKIDLAGQSSVIAGNEDACGTFTGDGGPAVLAGLNAEGLSLGPDGSIFIADSGNYRIRRVDKDGLISTVAGTGTRGYSGDGANALNANLEYIFDIAVRSDGAIYLGDERSYRLRLVNTDGLISTVAGVGPNADSTGLEGPATAAWVYPTYVALDPEEAPHLSGGEEVIVAIKNPAAGRKVGESLVPSEDGSQLYKFNEGGRHLQTLHALTGAVLWQFGYDAQNRLETATDGDGKITTIQRNGQGMPTAIVGPFGQVTQLNVDTNGFINHITNPAGEQLQIESTPEGLITESSDPRGLISTYGYDELGRLTSQSDNAGYSQMLVKSGSLGDQHIERITSLGRSISYDNTRTPGRNQENLNTAPDGSESTSQFAVSSGQSSATSRTGMTSTMTEGADPRWGMQSPMITVAEVNAPGGPTFTAASSSEAELTDPQDPLSLVSLTDTLEIDGRTTTTVYTAATRTLMQTSPEGRVSTLEIDAQGRVVSSQFGGLAPITASFNTLGQLESMTHGVGENARTTQFSYGANGFRSGLTDPLGRIVSYAYDAAGRMTAKTLPGNVEVGFGYNAAGELSSITPPGQAAHEFSHSKFGRLAGYNPPAVTDGGENAYSYNADRLLTGIDRPGGEGVTVEYDDNGRIGSLQLTEDGSPVATYSYSYVTATQVDTVIGPGAQTVSYSYQGDLVTGESWAGGVVGAVSWTWDSAFRLASENVTGGATVNFTYDADDLLTGAGSYVITRSMAHGLAQSAALGVMKDSWAYNDFGEVTGYTANANATSVYDLDYTRDDLGRITQKVETIVGVTDTWDYDYDPRGELIETRKNSVVVESYSYDTNGNRLSTTLNAITLNASYDAQDRLVDYGGTKYHYSPAGHLETRAAPGNQATGYDYDPAGNLRSVTLPDTTVVSYAYDGLDRRIERKVNGTITQRWLYDGGLLLAELDGDDNLVSQFVYAGGHVPVYLIQGGVNYRIITDQVGSVRLVVNANDGSIVQRLDYDSFGNVLQDTNPGLQPFGFAGGLQDPDTGLVLFGARDYDPLTGRWTAKDPLLFGGDDTNLYRYANNNPINLADPNGTDFWDNAHGFLMGIGEGTMKLLNLGLAIQSAVEGMTDWLIGDWLDENGFYRKPYAGMLYPPPAGVDTSDYLDGHFYGECSVDLLSLGAGGFVGAAPKLGALGGKLASAADKLRRIPDLFKGLGNGLGKGLGRAWDEAAKLGKKLWDSVALDASSLEKGKVRNVNRPNKYDKARSKPGRY